MDEIEWLQNLAFGSRMFCNQTRPAHVDPASWESQKRGAMEWAAMYDRCAERIRKAEGLAANRQASPDTSLATRIGEPPVVPPDTRPPNSP